MLIEFSVANFRSIKEKQTLSFIKTKKTELEQNYTTCTLSTDKTLELLNSVVIYGANASGKSNLIQALQVMVQIVMKSANYQQGESIADISPFLLSDATSNKPTEFELDFLYQNIRYVYGFSASQSKIIDEWLFQYPKGRPQNLIERNNTHEWGAMSALKGNKKLWKESTKENSLFLSTAAQLNCEPLNPAFAALNTIKFGVKEFQHHLTCHYAQGKHKPEILRLLAEADSGIQDFSVDEVKSEALATGTFPYVVRDQTISSYGAKTYDITIQHKTDTKTRVGFPLSTESVGTQKLFAIAGPWLEALEKGYCFVIDELHNSLHPKLVEYLVSMFHNPEINQHGAQLLFATHETALLNQCVFRRDQVFFCDKNPDDQVTQVYSLSDFSPRKGVENLERSYLSGRYGAVPFFPRGET
jgi:uncharacterized protein